MNRFANLLLYLGGLGFLGFGLWLVMDPAGVLAGVDIAANTPAGLVELRAFYGGLELGLGAFLLACARNPAWQRPGLWLTALGNGGIGLTRIAGIAMAGVFTPFFAYALAWEIGFSVAALIALRKR